MLVPKGQRRLDGLDAMIVSLYAGGMTIRDINIIWSPRSGPSCRTRRSARSPREGRRRGDQVWQHRELDALCPVIYLDASWSIRRWRARAETRRPHRRRGRHGRRQTRAGDLDPADRGRKFWASVCADLSNRGVADVLIVCWRLTGFAGGDRGDLAAGHGPNVCGAPDPGGDGSLAYGDRKQVAAASNRSTRHPAPKRHSTRSTRSPTRYRAANIPRRSNRSATPGSGSPRSWRSHPSCAGSSHHQQHRGR